VHALIAEMRRVVDEYPERVLIGEIYLPIERLVAYYGENLEGAHLPFNFQLIQAKWHARSLARMIDEYEAALPPGGWPNWVLGNHDKPRIASRIGPAQARVAAMLLLTLRGTPTMYYGDEIGLEDVEIPPEAVHDPWEKNEPGLGVGRDPQRSPMQWDPSPQAGFSTAKPWLPLSEDYGTRNVARLGEDPRSILTLYRQLIELRRRTVLQIGAYRALEADGDLLVYERVHEGERLLVALNLGSEAEAALLPSLSGRVLLSTHLDREEEVAHQVTLRPNEGVIVELHA
jgi:alpha-glucosidase